MKMRLSILVFFILIVNQGKACYCFDSLSLSQRIDFEMVQDYSVIFSGKLIELKIDGSIYNSQNENPEIYNFQIIESWHGIDDNSEVLSVYTRKGSCGKYFEMDSTYLIYGKFVEESTVLPFVYTDGCTRTKRLSHALEDLELLGPGKRHHIRNLEVKENKNKKTNWKLIVSLGLNLILIVIILRKKKKNITRADNS